MKLAAYAPPRTKIDLGQDQSISVRGIGVEDITFLIQVHKDDMDRVIEFFGSRVADKVSKDKPVDLEQLDSLIEQNRSDMAMTFIQHFPLLVANVIALAADEPESWENASRLPLPVQLEAVMSIARLTFTDVEGFKKFVGNVIGVFQSVAKRAPRETNKTPATKSTGTTG